MILRLGIYYIIITILLSILPANASLSVNPQIVNYSAASGLPSNEVTCITEDEMGMMWFGTSNGLARFDGYEFKIFRSDYLSPSFLKSNSIRFMKKAPDGRLWIVTNKEVAVFDTRTQHIHHIELEHSVLKKVKSLLLARNGDVYLGTAQGLYVYKNGESGFTLLSDEKLKKLYIYSLYEDRSGQIWVGTWFSGFYTYNPKNNEVLFYDTVCKGKSYRVTDFEEDGRGRIWVSTWDNGELIRLDSPEDAHSLDYKIFPVEFKSNMLSNPVMFNIEYDEAEEKLWVSTANGLYLMNDLENPASFTKYDSSDLKGIEVTQIYMCSRGILWTAVQGSGINKIMIRNYPFVNLDILNSQKDNREKIVTSLLQYKDSLLFIGERLDVFDVIGLNPIHRKESIDIPSLTQLSRKSNAVVNWEYDRKHSRVWIATRYDGVYCLAGENFRKAKLVRVRDKFDNIRFISDICLKPNGDLWCASGNRLFLLKYAKEKLTRKEVKVVADYIMDNNITSLCLYGGKLWIGTDASGIFSLDKNENITEYSVENGKLVYDNILCMYSNPQKGFWVGTNGGGLSKFDEQEEKFRMIPSVKTSSGNIIYSIIEDSGNLWMATGRGICRMSISDEASVKLYTSIDGIKNTQFSPGAAVALADHTLLFGGYNGVDCYNPIQDTVDSTAFSTAIVDISVMNVRFSELYNKEDNKLLPPYTKDLTLSYNQNNIMLTFSGLTYRSPSSVGYAYMLEGVDKEWIYVGADQRRVSYNNLQPGHYLFSVKSCNENGLWSAVETMSITILPPPWLTWWAYILYTVAIALVVYISYRIIHNRIKLQNELKIEQIERQKSDEVNQVKLKFFTNISHELFTPLSVMQCSVENLKMDKVSDSHTLDIMQINLRRLKRLLQQIMEFRKVESGNLKLKVSYNDIVPFIKNVCAENFQPLLERKNITMDFRCEQHSVLTWFDIDKLDKILYNLLSNALKYNYDGGVVTVSVKETDDKGKRNVVIVVENTGEGIPESKLPGLFRRFYEGDYRKFHTQGTGIGLSLTKDLVELHHGEITVSSIVGQMTSFVITLPADKGSYALDEIDESIVAVDNAAEREITLEAEEQKSDILLVEDNPDLLSVMDKVLSRVYNVHTAANGKEAMTYLKSEGKVDIIITDYVMPEMNGIELCKAIREDETLYYLPVVMLTAKTQTEFQKLGYAAGADVYLSKPIEMSVLIAQINSIIHNRKMVAKKYLSEETSDEVKEQEPHLSESDREFLDRLVAVIEENLDNSECTNDLLYAKMNTTQSTMYRRLKSLTGLSPNELIRDIRIKKACELLRRKDMQVSEVAYAVGFTDPKYFSLIFKKVKGMSPKKYIESL